MRDQESLLNVRMSQWARVGLKFSEPRELLMNTRSDADGRVAAIDRQRPRMLAAVRRSTKKCWSIIDDFGKGRHQDVALVAGR